MSEEHEIIVQAHATAIPSEPPRKMTVLGVIGAMIERGGQIDMVVLERMEALYERELARDRERKFNTAFACFKRDCPKIVRRTEDTYNTKVNRHGHRVKRKYATLEDIASAVDPVLAANGLAYSWSDPEVKNGLLTIRFVLSHADGHSRATCSPPIPVEGSEAYKAVSGGRQGSSASPQQRYGVATTYAQRYSMIEGLGLTSVDEDDDGRGSGAASVPAITDAQVQSLEDLIIALAEARGCDVAAQRDKLKAFKRINAISELPASEYDATAAHIAKLIEEARKAK